MPITKIKTFLDDRKIKYVTLKHSPAYTALEVAASAHVSGKEFAKTVIVKIDGKMAMAVLRASDRVDLPRLRRLTGADDLVLASEDEFQGLFPGCEVGAMPPFGNLYDMDVFVADNLAKYGEIAFNAGSHTELIRLSYADFDRLVQPKQMAFAGHV